MAAVPRLDLVHKAICAGTLGHIEWKDAAARLVRDNPEMNGLSPEGVRALLREYVRLNRGILSLRNETRAEILTDDPDDPFWYRVVFPVPDFPKELFVEVKLIDDDEHDPWVRIVSCHF
jgi:hypothetical protein